jgi:MFS family permease
MSQEKTTLWSRDFIVIWVATLFISIAYFVLITTLTVYVIDEFHASESQAGLAAGIYIIGTLFARLVLGKYIDMLGRKKLLYYGLLFFLLSMILYFFIDYLILFHILRFVHGAAYGVAHTVLATIINDIIPDKRRGEGTGYYLLSFTLGTAIGPFLGGIILEHSDHSLVFMVCTVFSIVSFIICLFLKIPETKELINSESINGFRWKDFFEKSAVPISIIAAIIGFCYSGILTFMTSYSNIIHLSTAGSLFFIVSSIFTIITRPFTGRLFDVKGHNIVLYPSLIIFIIGFVILSQANHGFTLLIAGAFVGISYGTIIPCAQAIAINESPKLHVGLATSTYLVLINAGIGIGPFLQGFIIELLDYRGLYLILAFIAFIGLLLYYLIHGKQHSKKMGYPHSVTNNY